jgi:plastocyanin
MDRFKRRQVNDRSYKVQTKMQVFGILTCVVTVCVAARPATAKYKPGEVKDGGTIVGVVNWEGAIPKESTITVTGKDKPCHVKAIENEDLVVSSDAKVRWAVAYIKKIDHGKPFGPEAKTPVVLDQNGCQFSPHVVVVQKEQPLRVLNSDGILHNVHLYARKNEPFNRSMPGDMKQLDVTFDYTERIHVGCDIHPWMSSWVVVAKHPYYAVTGADGTFRFENVPAGTYTIEVWQEKLGKKKAEVTVTAGGEARVEFSLKQK